MYIICIHFCSFSKLSADSFNTLYTNSAYFISYVLDDKVFNVDCSVTLIENCLIKIL